MEKSDGHALKNSVEKIKVDGLSKTKLASVSEEDSDELNAGIDLPEIASDQMAKFTHSHPIGFSATNSPRRA